MDAKSNFAFKTEAKPLQTETWLLLKTYKKSSLLYPTVSSPTFYDIIPFSHNTCVTDDRQTTAFARGTTVSKLRSANTVQTAL